MEKFVENLKVSFGEVDVSGDDVYRVEVYDGKVMAAVEKEPLPRPPGPSDWVVVSVDGEVVSSGEVRMVWTKESKVVIKAPPS